MLIPESMENPVAELFARRNQHGVPLEKIQQMISNFEGRDEIQKKIDGIK